MRSGQHMFRVPIPPHIPTPRTQMSHQNDVLGTRAFQNRVQASDHHHQRQAGQCLVPFSLQSLCPRIMSIDVEAFSRAHVCLCRVKKGQDDHSYAPRQQRIVGLVKVDRGGMQKQRPVSANKNAHPRPCEATAPATPISMFWRTAWHRGWRVCEQKRSLFRRGFGACFSPHSNIDIGGERGAACRRTRMSVLYV